MAPTALLTRQPDTFSTLLVTLEADSKEEVRLSEYPMDEMFCDTFHKDATQAEYSLTRKGFLVTRHLGLVEGIREIMCANFAFTFKITPGFNNLSAIREVIEVLRRHIDPELVINYQLPDDSEPKPLVLTRPDVRTDVSDLARALH